jgi:hypothetical protein
VSGHDKGQIAGILEAVERELGFVLVVVGSHYRVLTRQ